MAANPKVLAGLVADVLRTGNQSELSEDQSRQFYQKFQSNISEEVEELRAEKRRAYEEMKNIAVR